MTKRRPLDNSAGGFLLKRQQMKKTSRALAVILALSLTLCGCGKDESLPQSAAENSASTTSSQEAAGESSAPQTASATESSAEPQQETDKPASAEFKVHLVHTSIWQENGLTNGGCEVTIYNTSSTDVDGWTLTATIPINTEITSSWNGNITIDSKNFTATNADYNSVIPAGGSVSFGFNYASPIDFFMRNPVVNNIDAKMGKPNAEASDNEEQTTPAPEATSTTSTTTAEPATPPEPEDTDGTTPVSAHGQLSVSGTQLVDKDGNPYQLRGMSTHGLTWFPDFVNEDAFKTLRDDWNTNVVRLAMYIDEWGNGQCYMNNKQGSRELLEKGVDLCIKLDMYVIIDWHVLNPGDPTAYTDEAAAFFTDISEKYADYPNVIYEICNEPNGDVSWSGKVKPYAEKIIPIIRANDSDAVIIVGTPTWSQDIDAALADPLDFDNVMYALHFYSATHTDWLRDRVTNCVNSGLPVFASEFGVCDASGNGALDLAQAEKWLSLLDDLGISYCNWSLANKDESASAFKPSAGAGGSWSENDLTEGGKWIYSWFKNH